ncbi:MAG TPA: amidohydrolase family protein [Gemmatimonadaceae bacterium]|nr:amidohydrolase family protein [Gemmatimonadaceae bacterium]
MAVLRSPRAVGLLALATALAIPPLRAQPPSAPPATGRATLVIRDVTLIDGSGAPPRPHVSVVVRGDRIADIVPAGEGREPAADLVVDGSGRYAIPGLIDAHVHLSGAPWEWSVQQLARALRGGVTAVFDVAGDTRQTSDLARAAMAGEIDSPAIYYSALMAGPAFFEDPRVRAASLGYTPGEAPWARAVTPATDMAQAVAAARGTGATALKLYAALDSATAARAAAEARRQGLRVVAHATVFPARPMQLVTAGVTMLAHTPYLVWEGSPPTTDYTQRARGDFLHVPADSPLIERLLTAMRDRGVALNPTLWVFAEAQPEDSVSRVRTPWMYAVTRRAAELGVSIVAGTDGLVPPDGRGPPTLHRELALLVSGAGLTPLQALTAATSAAARAMGAEADRGILAPGRLADVVLLEADPTADIANTRRIWMVVKEGRIVAR